MHQTNASQAAASGLPIHSFSRCHDGIRTQLQSLARLPQQVSETDRAGATAQQALSMFRNVVFDHHAEEEKDLFPAVLAASNSEEYGGLRTMVDALTAEHRQIEALWRRLEPGLEQLAQGQPAQLDTALLIELVTRYEAHAQSEEEQFLPRAESILGRRDPSMAALGFSLHMRHQLQEASRNDVRHAG